MGATFPNGLASFTTKRNLLDDVDANDINKIQDEIRAIEATLGDALTTLQVIEGEVTILQQDEAASAAAPTPVPAPTGPDQSTLIKFQSLKDLISSLWDGQNIYAASAGANNLTLRNSPKTRPFPPDLVQIKQPYPAYDPMGMWNGTGFTLKASGFWVIQGQIEVNLASVGPTNPGNLGTYEGSITLNGTNWTRALDRQYAQVDGTWHDIALNPMFTGYLPKGTRITLRAAQSSSRSQRISAAHLSAYRVRS